MKKLVKKYKDLFEYPLDLIQIHDLRVIFLNVNNITLNALGYIKEEIIKKYFKN